MRVLLLLSLALTMLLAFPASAQSAAAEAAGLEPATTAPSPTPQPLPSSASRLAHYLAVSESTNDQVVLLDPNTGDVLTTAFLASNANLSTPVNAISDLDGLGLLVCDQITDVVVRYGADGTEEGIFAPAGGRDVSILDNVRGCTTTNDTLLVTTGATGLDAVQAFGPSGAFLSSFIPGGTGGLDGPFDVLVRSGDVLVPSIDTDNILRFSRAGAFLNVFATGTPFPEQIATTATGTVLVAEFTLGQILEYQADGTPVGAYTFPGLAGFRGVYELPSGNLIVTTGGGIFEVSRPATVVRTILAGVSGRFVELVSAGGVVAGEAAPSDAEATLRVAGPNPFRAQTTLELTVGRGQHVRAEVFDATGRRVAVLFDGVLGAGATRALTLRSSGLSAGVYGVRVTGETFSATRTVSHVE